MVCGSAVPNITFVRTNIAYRWLVGIYILFIKSAQINQDNRLYFQKQGSSHSILGSQFMINTSSQFLQGNRYARLTPGRHSV
jgi:hypothetical protein